MTIYEAISRVDALKPNTYGQSDKIRWLGICDGFIKNEVIDTHENADKVEFEGYTEDTDQSTQLLVPFPYDEEIYIAWLSAQIDNANEDYIRYTNSMTSYNTAYSLFRNWYNREHKPLTGKVKYF